MPESGLNVDPEKNLESALLKASPSERHLYEEWKRRDKGLKHGDIREKARFLDISELCSASKVAFHSHQGKALSAQKTKAERLADMVGNFDKGINQGGALRPQHPHMRCLMNLDKEVDITSTGTGIVWSSSSDIVCFSSSYFMLPGGSPAYIRRIFRQEFGIELPDFGQLANADGVRTMAGLAAFQDRRFYVAYQTCWKEDLDPYIAIMLLDLMVKTRAIIRDALSFKMFSKDILARPPMKTSPKRQKVQQKPKKGFGAPSKPTKAQPPAAVNAACAAEDFLPGSHAATLFPVRFYRKFKDLPDEKLPVLREVLHTLSFLHFGLAVGAFAELWAATNTSPDFWRVALGETQAPRGQWHPSMGDDGLIPHVDDVVKVLNESRSREICDLYWQLAELPDNKKEEWVNLDDVTRSKEPMLVVAAQAAWGADGTWGKLQADVQQWRIWKHLMAHSAPGFVADLQAQIHKHLQLKEALKSQSLHGDLWRLEATDSKSDLFVRVVSVMPITLEVSTATTGEPFVPLEEGKAQVIAELAAMLPQYVAQQHRLARERKEKEKEAASDVRPRTLYVTQGTGKGQVGRHLPASQRHE